MAGSYPDAPYRRMAWDEDGSILWSARATGNTYTSLVLPSIEYPSTGTQSKAKFNNEATLTTSEAVNVGAAVNTVGSMAFGLIFPELRDIYGIAYWCVTTIVDATDTTNQRKPNEFELSGNTTNAISGDWIELYPGFAGDATYPVSAPSDTYTWDFWYRIGIVTENLPATSIRAIRWLQPLGLGLIGQSHWHHIHIYGDKSAGATPDRLLFIDNDTGLEFQAPLDWGDVPRGTTLVHDIKMFNNSATFTANDIDLDFEALTGISDTWHTIRDSGGAYGGTLNIASMAPLTYYPVADVLTVKLTVSNIENLGPNASRLQAETASWT